MRGGRAWVALFLVLSSGRASAEGFDPTLQEALGRYLRDPAGLRAEMLRLGRELPPDAPPFLWLAVADADIRAGRAPAARQVLLRLVEAHPEPPWTDWSWLGLGWLAFAGGRFDEAREYYELAAATALGASVAPVAVGLVDGARRRTDDALRMLTSVGANTGAQPTIRALASLGVAYTRYWAGDLEAAAGEFEHVAAVHADSVFADDAAYAAAWTRWRLAPGEDAIARLRRVAERDPRGVNPKQVSRALVDLQPRALARASFKRYRLVPPGDPAGQLLALLDADGAGLARAALAVVETPAAAQDRPGVAPSADAITAAQASGRARSTGVVSAVGAVAGSHGRAWLFGLVASAVAIAVIAWRIRARLPTTASRLR